MSKKKKEVFRFLESKFHAIKTYNREEMLSGGGKVAST